MTDKSQPPPQPPLDQRSIWSGMAGSIVALIMTTILSLRQTSSRCGTKMDPVLEHLINTFSKDANNFILALNRFCSSTSQTLDESESLEKSCIGCCSFFSEGSTSVSQQTESSCECVLPNLEDEEEESGCACEEQPKNIQKDIVCECESDKVVEHIHTCVPKLEYKETDDIDSDTSSSEGSDFPEISEMEKAVPVCIIEDEFTEISSYTVDPITKKIKICTVEEHSQLAKCTLLKHQAIQACECTDDKGGKTPSSDMDHAGPAEKVKNAEPEQEMESLVQPLQQEPEDENLHVDELSKDISEASETVEDAFAFTEDFGSEASEEISSMFIDQVYSKELTQTMPDITAIESTKGVLSSNQHLETIDETDRSAVTEKSYASDKSEELISKSLKTISKESRNVSEGAASQAKDSDSSRRKAEEDASDKSDLTVKKPSHDEEEGKKDELPIVEKQTSSFASSQSSKAASSVAGDAGTITETAGQALEKRPSSPKTPDSSRPSSKSDSRRSLLPISISSRKSQTSQRPATPGSGSQSPGSNSEKLRSPTASKGKNIHEGQPDLLSANVVNIASSGAWAAPKRASSEKTVPTNLPIGKAGLDDTSKQLGKFAPDETSLGTRKQLGEPIQEKSARDDTSLVIPKESRQSGESIKGGSKGSYALDEISLGTVTQSRQSEELIQGGSIGKSAQDDRSSGTSKTSTQPGKSIQGGSIGSSVRDDISLGTAKQSTQPGGSIQSGSMGKSARDDLSLGTAKQSRQPEGIMQGGSMGKSTRDDRSLGTSKTSTQPGESIQGGSIGSSVRDDISLGTSKQSRQLGGSIQGDSIGKSARDDSSLETAKQPRQPEGPIQGGSMGKSARDDTSLGTAKQSRQPAEPIQGGGIGKSTRDDISLETAKQSRQPEGPKQGGSMGKSARDDTPLGTAKQSRQQQPIQGASTEKSARDGTSLGTAKQSTLPGEPLQDDGWTILLQKDETPTSKRTAKQSRQSKEPQQDGGWTVLLKSDETPLAIAKPPKQTRSGGTVKPLRDGTSLGTAKQSSQPAGPTQSGGMGRSVRDETFSGMTIPSSASGEPIRSGGTGTVQRVDPIKKHLLRGAPETAGKDFLSQEQSGRITGSCLKEKEIPKRGEHKPCNISCPNKKETEKDKDRSRREESSGCTAKKLVWKEADEMRKGVTCGRATCVDSRPASGKRERSSQRDGMGISKDHSQKVTPFAEKKKLQNLEKFAQGFVSSLSREEKLEYMADYIRRSSPGLSDKAVKILVEASCSASKKCLETRKPAPCMAKRLDLQASGSTPGFKKSKPDTSFRPCLCPSQRGIKESYKSKSKIDSSICPSRCGTCAKPEANPHAKDWSKKLGSAGQTLASLRERITDFNRTLNRSDDHRSTPDTQIRKRQERSQSYPLPSGSLPCTTTMCPCPALGNEHSKGRYSNMMRPVSSKKASRVNVNSTLLGHPPSVGVQAFPLPLMPQEAIAVQPGYLTDSSKRPRSSRTRAHTSKVDYM